MTSPRRPLVRQRGFSLLESLIALAITAFGLLAIAGVSLKLANSEDVARQRGEAARLAQEKIEELRAFTQIDSAAGAKAWADMAANTVTSSETIADNGTDFHANTSFQRSWKVLDSASDAWRRVQVSVTWQDRVGGSTTPNTLSFSTIISKTDPFDSGALTFPLPGNTTLKRPKNRNLNIPVPATDLGEGKSAIKIKTGLYAVFSNDTGWIVKTCAFDITTASQLTLCDDTTAYILAGYISLDGPSSFPVGLAINTAQTSGSSLFTCEVKDAEDQNNSNDSTNNISGYKYYICVVKMPANGTAWSGTVRLAAPTLNTGTADYLVCRFQYASATGVTDNMRNVQPYASVADSLDNQNYVITDANSCPTITSLATTQHQNCRSSNPNKNINRATDCPAI